MTPRSTINFFRHSRTGAFLVFLVLLGIGYILYVRFIPPTKTATIRSRGRRISRDIVRSRFLTSR